MIVLNVSENRELSIISRGNTYENENNAEKIKIFFPGEINSHKTSDCIINLNIMNENGGGDVIDITQLLEKHSNGGYYCEVNVSNKVTYTRGKILLWFEIINAEYNMVAKTSIVRHTIVPHSNASEIIPEQKLSILDDLQIKMSNIMSDIADIQEYVNTLKQGVVLLAKRDNTEL